MNNIMKFFTNEEIEQIKAEAQKEAEAEFNAYKQEQLRIVKEQAAKQLKEHLKKQFIEARKTAFDQQITNFNSEIEKLMSSVSGGATNKVESKIENKVEEVKAEPVKASTESITDSYNVSEFNEKRVSEIQGGDNALHAFGWTAEDVKVPIPEYIDNYEEFKEWLENYIADQQVTYTRQNDETADEWLARTSLVSSDYVDFQMSDLI